MFFLLEVCVWAVFLVDAIVVASPVNRRQAAGPIYLFSLYV